MTPHTKAAPQLSIGTLQWAVGAYCLLVGAVVLVAPHLAGAFLNASFAQFRAVEGILFLAAGLALIAAAVTVQRPSLFTALHVFAGGVLLMRALEIQFAFGGFYTGTSTHLLLGLGAALAPFVAGVRRPDEASSRSLFSFVVSAILIVNAIVVLRQPAGVQGLLAGSRPLLPWFSAAFLATGVWLAAAEIRGVGYKTFYRAAHLSAGAVIIAFPLPNLRFQAWLGIALYGIIGLVVALRPWVAPWLARVDPASLRVRLTVTLAGLGAVPLIAIATLLAFRLEQGAVQQSFRLQESIAVAISQEVEDFVSLHQSATQRLAAEPGLLRLPPGEQQAMLERANLAFPQVTGFSLVDAAGRNLAKSHGLRLFPVSDNPYFLEARRTNQPQVGVSKGISVPGTFITLTVPIRDRDGRFDGIVMAGINTTRMANVVARTVGRIGGESYIVDGARRIVVHPDDARVLSQAPDSGAPPPDGSLRYRGPTGEHLASAAQIPQLGWTVVIDRPEAIALAELLAQRNLTLAGLLAGILAACLIGAVMARTLTSPLQSLASATIRLADGDVAAPLAKSGIKEIDELSFTFDQTRHLLAERTQQRDRAETELRQLNEALESRVEDRTAQLREANQTLHAVIRSSALPIVCFDTLGNITAWNPAAERVFGWSEQELLGGFSPIVPDDRVQDYFGVIERARNGELIADYETRRQTRDRGQIEVSLSLSSIHDQAGQVNGFLSIITDITERKRAEEQMRQAQKLESVGLLAGGIAHDFNNLLVGVLGNASLAREMLPPGHPASELLDRVVETGEQAAHLTRQMLAYSGKGRFVIEPINLSDLIPEMSGIVQPSIAKKIAMRFELDPDLAPIEADRGQVQQVFMNLVLNAADAIGSNAGLISVKTGIEDVDARHPRRDPSGAELRPGRYVYLEVRDTGCGMDEATKARIFDPFFSTKFVGRGLGLAAVDGIVRGHKGSIQVTSTPGKGTCFTVLFPAADRAAAPAFTAATGSLRGVGTVLVVDDEEVVRAMAKKALERYGYQVLVADGGLAAMDVCKRHPGDISLVVLDLSMPAMSGEETLPELRKIRPGIRVVVSSGYSEAETMRFFQGYPVSGFIQKPYTSGRLAETVKLCLR